MKKMNDEELQRLLEQKEYFAEDATANLNQDDVDAYRLLFDALNEKPDLTLPYNLAEQVTLRLEAETAATTNIKTYIFAFLTFVLVIGAITAIYFAASQRTAVTFIQVLNQYKWIFCFAIFSFLLIQYLDQKLIKNKNLTS